VRSLAVFLMVLATAGGCGFVNAGHASRTKPSGFVLRGYVSVALPDGGAAGAPCQAPGAVTDVRPAAAVRVVDPAGHAIAAGQLGAGVVAVDAASARCNFPFEIRAVPGGRDRYLVEVDGRPPVGFPAEELRQDKPAVITIDSR
jgi:hypothetical protein